MFLFQRKVCLCRYCATGFTGHVVIYTDNTQAAKKWRDRPTFLELAKRFYSVNVYCIDRGNNKCVDKLIRNNDIMMLPRGKMDNLIDIYLKNR